MKAPGHKAGNLNCGSVLSILRSSTAEGGQEAQTILTTKDTRPSF